MPLTRIYCGRVTKIEVARSEQVYPVSFAQLDHLENALWQHHRLFQHAVNHHIVSIAALADPQAPADDVLRQFRDRVCAEWNGGPRKRGSVTGFGLSVAPFLGLHPHSPAEVVFAKILEGNTAPPAVRHLAGLLLLEKCQGDAGISQGGRTYLPPFCAADSTFTPDFSPASRAAQAGKAELAARIHNPDTTPAELSALASQLSLSWTVKIQPSACFTGATARNRLEQAVRFFQGRIAQESDPRIAAWAQAHEGAAWLTDLPARIAALPDTLTIPANRKAAQELTFATLLFQHFPSPTSAALLALFVKAPKKPKSAASKKAATAPVKPVVDFARFGDDPIVLARGARGYVYRGFTALPALFPDADSDPAVPARMTWKEFDIAAFKEALKAVNQFRLKTEERNARRAALAAKLDYQRAHTEQVPRDNAETAADREPDSTPRLGDDPRFLALQSLLAQLAAKRADDSEEHGIRRRGLRGWRGLLKIFRQLHQKGERDASAYLAEVTRWQTEHVRDAGDIQLFRALADPANHPIWKPPAFNDVTPYPRADDVVWATCLHFEDKEEFETLLEPVRLTPADAIISPRQFIFSDITGKEGLKSVTADTWELTALARTEPGVPPGLHRLRVTVSTPRLRRDELQAIGEAATQSAWLPPILTGLLGETEARRHAPLPVRDFAFGLMPEPRLAKTSDRQLVGLRRLLVNFPVTLNVDALANRIGRPAYWLKQFNRLSENGQDQFLHLLWPGMKNAPADETAWWSRPEGLSALAIDLGQRTAAAAVVLEMRADDRFTGGRRSLPYPVGQTSSHTWRVAVLSTRHLRLPGEDRALLPHEIDPRNPTRHEKSGAAGRLASRSKWEEALEIARLLGEENPEQRLRALTGEAAATVPPDKAPSALTFPEHNDELLHLARAAANRVRQLHSLSWRLISDDPETANHARSELEADPKLYRPGESANDAVTRLGAEFESGRRQLQNILLRLTARIVPRRHHVWTWRKLDDGKRGELVAEPSSKEKIPIAGQRGLSLARIEQIENLRRRFLSLNRLLRFEPAKKPDFGSETRGLVVGEPCPDLLEKIERIKEERINQTAHLILAEALGVRLRAHDPSDAAREERKRRDIHGEYEPIPGRRPVDMIVLENLDRYLSSQDRAPSENRRLMQWAHRALVDKICLLAEPFGIPVVTVPAAYSSRFCARTGVVGFRAEEIHAGQLDSFEWRQLETREKTDKPREHDRDLIRLRNILRKLPPRVTKNGDTVPFTLLCPKKGAQMFVPICSPDRDKTGLSQADINAAINIGLRALASPQCLHARPRWRLDLSRPADGTMRTTPVGASKEGGNKLERALWSEARLDLRLGADAAKAYSGKRTLLFHDAADIAKFDRGTVTIGTTVARVATGRALFKAVKDLQWSRIHALNRARLAKARLLTPEIAHLFPPDLDESAGLPDEF